MPPADDVLGSLAVLPTYAYRPAFVSGSMVSTRILGNFRRILRWELRCSSVYSMFPTAIVGKGRLR